MSSISTPQTWSEPIANLWRKITILIFILNLNKRIPRPYIKYCYKKWRVTNPPSPAPLYRNLRRKNEKKLDESNINFFLSSSYLMAICLIHNFWWKRFCRFSGFVNCIKRNLLILAIHYNFSESKYFHLLVARGVNRRGYWG